MTTRRKPQAATLTPQQTQRRFRPLQRAQSARVLAQLAQHQGAHRSFHIIFVLTVPLRLKRLRAIDPFESSSMVHPSATGLVDDWRTKIMSPYSTTFPQSLAPDLQAPDNMSLLSPMSSTMMISCASTPSPFSPNVCDHACRLSGINLPSITQREETFILPRIVNGSKSYPGVKNLPLHLRPNFRNEFIRSVIKQVANSQSPWINPDVQSLQSMYELIYPAWPARIRHSDAVYHPVSYSSIVIHRD